MMRLVFVHGAGMDHTVWRFQTRWLAARGVEVLAPDLPGHGRTAGKPVGSVEEIAGWLDDHMGDRPVTAVGHSLGSLAALQWAAVSPGTVQRLVLVSTSPRMEVHPELLRAAEADLPTAARLIAGWSYASGHRGGHPEPGTWERGGTVRLVEASKPGALATDLAACPAYDGRVAAPRVTVPTLVVAGSADRMTPPRGAEELADLIPTAELVVMDGAGHAPMIEAPRRFNEVLGEFLRR